MTNVSPHKKLARLVGLNHIALEVGDVEEALAFYGRIFDFKLRGKAEGSSLHRHGRPVYCPRERAGPRPSKPPARRIGRGRSIGGSGTCDRGRRSAR